MTDNPLPNPTKRIRTKFSIAKVQESVKALPSFTTGAELVYFSDVMGYYKFAGKGSGILNFGMFLDLTLLEISENHTEILLECRRQIGWINRSVEYDECINYMSGCIGLLGKVLTGEAQKPAQATK